MTQQDTNNDCLDLEAQSLDELGRKMDCGNIGEKIDERDLTVEPPHSSGRREAKKRELLDQPFPAD
jgi:hypothetical protein